jgi:7-cyano-7-deazaguanine synthase
MSRLSDSPSGPPAATSAVLLSGGLDSAVLVAEEAQRGVVQPIYVSVGLRWETEERRAAAAFLAGASLPFPVCTLVSLSVDMTDIYPPTHWARSGVPPGYDSRDEEVYLAGRNIILLGKAAVFCAVAGISRLNIGTLAHNPFPDATPAFREGFGQALAEGLGRPLEIVAPYAEVEKKEVIRRGTALGLPLMRTLSCMQPAGWSGEAPVHCGRCNKCRERREAYRAAGLPDPTRYAEQASEVDDPVRTGGR